MNLIIPLSYFLIITSLILNLFAFSVFNLYYIAI